VQLEDMNTDLQHYIQKYSEGKLTLKELLYLSEQLADKHNSISGSVLHDDWKYQLESDTVPDHDLHAVLDRVYHQISINEKNKLTQFNWLRTFQRIAAILILPLLFTFLTYFYFHNKPSADSVSFAEIQCPMGVRTKFQLPDGSTGFLNSGSILKYPVQFSHNRTVQLTGEAFFDIVHNNKLPFHVNTCNLDIKVLGTTFNVIANEDEKTEEIVLQTGKVDVSAKNGNQVAVLAPNEQLILNTEKLTFAKNKVEAIQYMLWKEGKLVFRNENMQQVARRLSRWYNAEVIIGDKLLEDYTFHATFIDEPLDEVLKLLSLTTPISYKEEKRTNDKEGVFKKRKIILSLNQSKIKQFR
jgi:transmembrane sensor